MLDFKLVSQITNIEIIAISNSIRDLARLNRTHGKGRWRKLKALQMSNCRAAEFGLPKFIGMKRTVSEKKR